MKKGLIAKTCPLCLAILNSILLNLPWVWFCSKGLILFQRVWFCPKDCARDVPTEARGNVAAWRNKPTTCTHGAMLQKAVKSPINFQFYSSGAGYSSVGRASHQKASCNTDAGSIPSLVWQGIFLLESTFCGNSLMVFVCSYAIACRQGAMLQEAVKVQLSSCFNQLGRDNSVGKASEWNRSCNTDEYLILYLVRHRIFLLISLAAVSSFGLTKTLHTLVGMGSAALVAAVALLR